MATTLGDFRGALGAFTASALGALRANLAGGVAIPQRMRQLIVDEAPGTYRTEGRAEIDWRQLVTWHHRLFLSLPEFSSLAGIARSTPEAWRHVETPFRIAHGQTQLNLELAAVLAVEEALRRAGAVDVGGAMIAGVVDEFVEFLAVDQLDHIIRVPLVGLTLEAAVVDVHRGYDIQPLQRTDREAFIDDELEMAWRPTPGESWGHAWAELRRTVSIDKWGVDERKDAALSTIVEDTEAVLVALRLVKGNAVEVAGRTVRPAGWIPLGLGHFRSGQGRRNRRSTGWTQLSASDGAEVRELAGRHAQAVSERRHAYAESARRMALGAERGRLEDALIDYMIALEAMLMADGHKTELSYRLALRCAAACAKTPAERLQIFGQMKRAYDLRSGVVHGARSGRASSGPRRESLAASLGEVEGLLRIVHCAYLRFWTGRAENEFAKAAEHAVVSGAPMSLGQE